MIDRAATLAVHSNTALPLALQTAISDVDDFFASKTFKDFSESKKNQAKNTTAMFARLDGISKAIGALIKTVGQSGRVR